MMTDSAERERLDRVNAKVDANAKEMAERFGRVEERSRAAGEQCEKEYVTIREQIGAGARALGGVEARVGILEGVAKTLDASHKRVASIAEEARTTARQSVHSLEGIQSGLIEHMRRAETASLAREKASDATRDESRRKNEARFESLGDAVHRQAVGIATVGEGVTDTRAYMELFARRVLFAVIALGVVILACGGVVVVTVLSARTPDTVTTVSSADAGASK